MTNHPNRSRNAAELRGHYREDNNISLVPGMLYLRRDDRGRWYDPGMVFPDMPDLFVVARRYQVTGDLWGVEIANVGGGPFYPDGGECERIGLPIANGRPNAA